MKGTCAFTFNSVRNDYAKVQTKTLSVQNFDIRPIIDILFFSQLLIIFFIDKLLHANTSIFCSKE